MIYHKKILTFLNLNILKAIAYFDSKFNTDFSARILNKENNFHNPNYSFKSNEIAFIHVPKTGGTSLHKILKTSPVTKFINLNAHRPISLKCPVGEYKYITVLRDPIERVWSYYNMILRETGKAGFFPYTWMVQKGFEFFMNNCWEVNNVYCRYYSGKISGIVTDEIKRTALANLKKFDEIIWFDSFDLEINKVKKYGIELNEILHERKFDYKRPTKNQINLIIGKNEEDIELYEEINLYFRNNKK